MEYKYVHQIDLYHHGEIPLADLKLKIAQEFSELLMKRTAIERREEPGRVIHEAKVGILHESQMKDIDVMLSLLMSIPSAAPIAMELRREIFEM